MRKFIIIFLATVFGLIILAFGGLYFVFEILCKGQLSSCYRAVTQTTNSDSFFNRQWDLEQFTASDRAAAFKVVVGNRGALVFVDLAGGQARLIYDDKADYWHPYLSEDGNRIVLVRALRDNSAEILSCEIATWRCRVILRTKDAIRSPIEVDANTIVYASSPPLVAHDGRVRYIAFDVHIVRSGQAATRLSFLEFRSIERLSLSKDAIAFSAQQRRGSIRTVEDYTPPQRSHVYVLPFDRAAEQIQTSKQPLVPVFAPTVLWGTSRFATLSPDGSAAVVVTGRTELSVMDLQGQTVLRFNSDGDTVSPAVFAGKDVIFGELYYGKYAVRRLNVLQGSSQEIAAFSYSQDALQKLEQINLTIEN